MRYVIVLLALVVAACGKTPDGRIVASSSVCGPMGPITGCPDHKSDPPVGGEFRVRNLFPNSMCFLSSENLGGRPIALLAGDRVKLPHGPFGAHRSVQVTADCCRPDGSVYRFDRFVVPADGRDVSIRPEHLYRIPGLDPEMCSRLAS